MLNARLKTVCQFVDQWCDKHAIKYNVVCDEGDLQGVLIFRKDRPLVARLLADLEPLIAATGVHLETTKVRGGTILAFSIKAISEAKLAALIAEAGEEKEPMSFADKIIDAFSRTVAKTMVEDTAVNLNPGTFLITALKVVDEAQYKTPTNAIGHNTLERNSHRPDKPGTPPGKGKTAITNDSDDPQATTGASQPSTGPATRFEERVARTLEVPLPSRRHMFGRQLAETLQGMATPNGAQPGDLFTKFAQALQVLGQNMGTGPLQDQLKKQGINWKKSEDGQSIILYIVNASTNAPQPIARISAATLEKPSDFETQLLNIMDFAKGDAPGTFKQKQQELQNQEKAAREIAKQLGPQDQNAVAQQMAGTPQPGLQGMAMPTQPAPPGTQSAPQAAASQAALPKPGI